MILALVQAAVVAGATSFAEIRRFRHCCRRAGAAVRGDHAENTTLGLGRAVRALGSIKELITLNGQELQKIAGDCTVELPGADLERRVGPDWHLYKVCGKVFMLMTDMPGRPVVILKADPDDAAALREQYADITPGYHMNKRHWITLEGGGTIDEKLVKDLVIDSYRLVIGGLPKSEQPVDPRTYGRRA
ncbi:Predicted DNA-binding protein, MmcQ/YjbR family [Streptosporangium subroseum]|uniref:Predicted DNA-binding protein, MmcQ/YjbR family n=1 Tax=Streptosporangium subroseum TaxID=106412 RepID=A0A239P6J8_9ACTN|nr:Predicted DNA-binding protein, MmcQ/YjbR family [Streptosporangium subroseum]